MVAVTEMKLPFFDGRISKVLIDAIYLELTGNPLVLMAL